MDDIWQRDEVESPCVQVCVIHRESGLCMGCYRSINEITRWSNIPSDERRALISELPNREKLVRGKRRGGRNSRL